MFDLVERVGGSGDISHSFFLHFGQVNLSVCAPWLLAVMNMLQQTWPLPHQKRGFARGTDSEIILLRDRKHLCCMKCMPETP